MLMKTFTKLINTVIMAAILFAFTSISLDTKAQVVTHPISGISTTAQFFSYMHRVSDSTGIEIKYFVVKAPNGDIKTAADACDVCWAHYKGYVQLGTFMRCVNCGNSYPIDNLGSVGTGGCWPSYVPHTEDALNVIIQETDLIAQAGKFQEVPMWHVGIGNVLDLPSSYIIAQRSDDLLLTMPQIEAERVLRVVNMQGQVIYRTITTANEEVISTANMPKGVYFITIESKDKKYIRKISLN